MKPTAYKGINEILSKILINIKNILGDKFIGMYLSGSLAYGDFNYRSSDVDFVVVAKNVPKKLYPELKRLSEELLVANSKWRKRFEGLIMPLGQFRKFDHRDRVIPAINLDGKFTTEEQTTDSIIQRYIISKHPVILEGPDPRRIIEPISKDDLKKATLTDLVNWWKPKLKNTNFVVKRDYQAYAVLTMCRILYTLVEGDLVSKPAAARWAMKKLDKRWRKLIKRSLNWRNDDGINDREGAFDFVKNTLQHSLRTHFYRVPRLPHF